MNDVLADIHTAVWSRFEPTKLSAAALSTLQNAEAAGGKILVSTISLIEATYLTEKGKLAAPILPGL